MERRGLNASGQSQKDWKADWMNSPTTEEATGKALEANLPLKLAVLRQKLGQKAKQEKRFRFYSLYGHICEMATLEAAWKRVRANGGVAGVDGVRIEDIEKAGVEGFLKEIAGSLKDRTYRTGMVRRVYIQKANGKLRPLGIPTVRDRVVQTAVLLILEPIFEADFEDCSYGFRPGKSAHDALEAVQGYLKAGYTSVYDADLEGYFDSIPHDKLIACLRMRVVDGAVLGLIRQWLKAPVKETPSDGKPTVKRNKKGTPQGGVISPLLANVYLHWFDKLFNGKEGPAQWANAKLVRYADDFVVLARYVGPRITGYVESKLEGWLALRLNREKTRVYDLHKPGNRLDFLGYSFRYDRDLKGGAWRYLNMFPSKKSVLRERSKLREMAGARQCFKPLPNLIDEINRHLRGWAEYYGKGYPRGAYRNINAYVRGRLARHMQRRSQRGWRPREGTSSYAHLNRLGLVYL